MFFSCRPKYSFNGRDVTNLIITYYIIYILIVKSIKLGIMGWFKHNNIRLFAVIDQNIQTNIHPRKKIPMNKISKFLDILISSKISLIN